ncbi:MAG: nucleolar protein [Neisseria mucosa]|nr:nucleolar protein [Neisseria mucosa]
MTSTIKQAGYFLVSSFVLGISLHAAATVYSCGNGSYTSEPNSSCAQAQLPKISGHQGSGYHLNIRSLHASDERVNAKPKKKKRTEKSDKPSKNKNGKKAKKQQPMPSEQE